MHLSVKRLEREKAHFDVTYPLGKIDFSDTKFRQISALRITGVAGLVGGTEEIRIRGHITSELEGECDRCLEPAPLAVDRDFDICYRTTEMAPAAPETEIDERESEVAYYEGDDLALSDVAREQVVLWLPMQYLCKPDCKGICPVCGENRNRVSCGCRSEAADDRWAALLNYRPPASR